MVDTFTSAGAATLPLAPKNPLPYWVQLKAIRDFGAGLEKLRDAGGPVTRIDLGPKWAAIHRWWLSRRRRAATTFFCPAAFLSILPLRPLRSWSRRIPAESWARADSRREPGPAAPAD
jgi:hypothetical protein